MKAHGIRCWIALVGVALMATRYLTIFQNETER